MNEVDWYMSLALDEAQKAFYRDEVPVGAIIVSEHNEVVAQASNTKEHDKNPCGHAEVNAIMQAAQREKSWRLNDYSMYITLEPCPMCLSAISQARIKKIYFGAYDPKGGAISLGYNLHNDSRLNHIVEVEGGINHFESSKLLSDFFKAKRKTHLK